MSADLDDCRIFAREIRWIQSNLRPTAMLKGIKKC